MRRERDIIRAHDVLVAVLLGETPVGVDDPTLEALEIAADTLCWVLMHEHNETFATNLAKIEAFMKKRGFTLREVQ